MICQAVPQAEPKAKQIEGQRRRTPKKVACVSISPTGPRRSAAIAEPQTPRGFTYIFDMVRGVRELRMWMGKPQVPRPDDQVIEALHLSFGMQGPCLHSENFLIG